jgi:hypothetical protein
MFLRSLKLLLLAATMLWLAGCEKADIEYKRTDTLKNKLAVQPDVLPASMNVYFGNQCRLVKKASEVVDFINNKGK